MASRTSLNRLATRTLGSATRPRAILRSSLSSTIQSQITIPTLSRSSLLSSRSLTTSQTFRKDAPPEADPSSDIQAYNFESLSRLVSNPSPSSMIIDVREPSELQQSGRVPGAQNVPINSAPDGLFLPAEEFEDRFGFEKPSADTEVVFYCKAGVRSRAAARVAKMAGWRKVGEYPGSWMDWEKNGGKVEK